MAMRKGAAPGLACRSAVWRGHARPGAAPLRIAIAAIGRLKSGPERDLVDRYVERARALGRQIGLTGFDIAESAEARAGSPAERKKQEAEPLLARLAPTDIVIALDETGRGLTSPDLARKIGAWRDENRPAARFLVGGPDGLDRAVRQRADLVLSFSPLTWPHQLVRVMLAEQLYRAATLLAGHPYHRN